MVIKLLASDLMSLYIRIHYYFSRCASQIKENMTLYDLRDVIALVARVASLWRSFRSEDTDQSQTGHADG